jgi:hypothetical protein
LVSNEHIIDMELDSIRNQIGLLLMKLMKKGILTYDEASEVQNADMKSMLKEAQTK